MTGLILKLQYLTGRSVATAYNDRERAEWPPHPARVYFALAEAWAEHEHDASERAALDWLASLEPPAVYASEVSQRQVVPHFVPVNDTAVLAAFESQRDRVEALCEALEAAQTAHERARRAGDARATDKAARALAQAEKAHGKARKSLEQLLLEDQRPYAMGKYPKSALASAEELLPDRRGRQPRAFPSVTPEDPRVFMRWTVEPGDLEQHRAALEALASRVVRVGHSASFAACTWVNDGPSPNWEPNEEGELVLRLPGPGQLASLEDAFQRHHGIEPRVLPCRYQRYREVVPEGAISSSSSVFGDDWIVFRQVEGRRLSQVSAVEIARAMRGALMKFADDPAPEILSGHGASGEPSDRPHLALVPLPFVGSRHATGDVLGLALIFPREASEQDRLAVLRAVGQWEKARRAEEEDEVVDAPPLALTLGRAGVIAIERIDWGLAPLKTLRSASWCHPSRAWVTATPIALDRNPGDLSSADPSKAREAYRAAEQCISLACERIGLPAPSDVQIHPSVPLAGGAKARVYPPFPADPKKHQRVKVHARIEFEFPVRGPLLLGAGRYYGLGLCMPHHDDGRAEA